MNDTRLHAHQLIDRMPDVQLASLVTFLEAIVDPANRVLPVEDEAISEQQETAVARPKEWLKNNAGIPFEQVVADLGFSMDEIVGDDAQDPAA